MERLQTAEGQRLILFDERISPLELGGMFAIRVGRYITNPKGPQLFAAKKQRMEAHRCTVWINKYRLRKKKGFLLFRLGVYTPSGPKGPTIYLCGADGKGERNRNHPGHPTHPFLG